METAYAFDFRREWTEPRSKRKNRAAWIESAKALLIVKDAAYPDHIGSHDIVIKNQAVAINPVDWKVQEYGGFILKYPNILGEDTAGEVVEVGEKVTNFNKGDRVVAHALGLGTGKPRNGGFQLYPVLSDLTAAKIPDSLSFKDASVLPLSISTAAAGLYLKSALGIPYVPDKKIAPKNTSILVWGGSSSVGSSAVQLAAASGLIVVATASRANFDYVKSLGASLVLDYHRESIIEDLATTLNGSTVVGVYDAIGLDASTKPAAAVLHKLGGGKIASVLNPPEDGIPDDVQVLRIQSNNLPSEEPELSRAIYHDFVEAALEDGRLRARPEALVVGEGLHNIQRGLDRQRAGVSAKKVVVEL